MGFLCLDHFLHTRLSPDYFYDDVREGCATACYCIVVSAALLAAFGFGVQLLNIRRKREAQLIEHALLGREGSGRKRRARASPDARHAARESDLMSRMRAKYHGPWGFASDGPSTPYYSSPSRSAAASPPSHASPAAHYDSGPASAPRTPTGSRTGPPSRAPSAAGTPSLSDLR